MKERALRKGVVMQNDKKSQSMLKNSAMIAVLVLFGKLLGFAKQSIQAWAFGTTAMTDTYLSADGYMSMIGQILSTSLAPVVLTSYIKVKSEKDDNRAKQFVKTCIIIFSLISGLIIVLNAAFAKPIAKLIGVSYTSSQLDQLSQYIYMLLPIILAGSIVGVTGGYLQGKKIFWPTQLLTYFFSISIIVCIFIFKDSIGINSVVVGFVLAYILYSLTLIICAKDVFRTNGLLSIRSDEIKDVIRRLLPLIISTSIVDVGHLIDRVVASSLSSGSVSYLYYGQIISNDIVFSVFVIPVSTVLLPTLTEDAVSGNRIKVRNGIKSSISTLLFILAAIAVLYIVAGHDLIELVFQRGNFDSVSTDNVFRVVCGYTVGMFFMAGREILTKGHYAYHDTFHPMLNSILGMIINMVLSILLSKKMGSMGISLATSISYFVVFCILLVSIQKHIGKVKLNTTLILDAVKVVIAMVISYLLGRYINSAFIEFSIIARLCVEGILILLVYIGISLILKCNTAIDLFKMISSKFKRNTD